MTRQCKMFHRKLPLLQDLVNKRLRSVKTTREEGHSRNAYRHTIVTVQESGMYKDKFVKNLISHMTVVPYSKYFQNLS